MRLVHGAVHNIGPGQQRQRRLMGIGLLLASVGGLGLLFALDSSRWWRCTMFFPLWGSMLGFFQARTRT